MKRKRKAGTFTTTIKDDKAALIAAEVSPFHRINLERGYKLLPNCRAWLKKDGSWTLRFVYRDPQEIGSDITVVAKGIVLG